MILYHGSKVIVERPDVVHSRRRVDFGPGFYATPLIEQAKGLCRRYVHDGLDRKNGWILFLHAEEDRINLTMI